MLTSARHAGALLAVGLAGVVSLTACSGDDGTGAAASSSPASGSSASGPTARRSHAPDLASGLLPASAFGPDAAVVAMTLDQLQHGAGIAAAGSEGLQITPESCSAAVQGAQPSFDQFSDVAGEGATTGSAATVEVLVRGGPTKNAVSQLADAVERCPQATITSPQIGQATITFQSLPVDDLGDAAALLRYTTVVALPGGPQVTLPALVGFVQDSTRLVVLTTVDTGSAVPGGAPAAVQDPVAFADLLRQAVETQGDALD